jgi:hypothetical protein
MHLLQKRETESKRPCFINSHAVAEESMDWLNGGFSMIVDGRLTLKKVAKWFNNASSPLITSDLLYQRPDKKIASFCDLHIDEIEQSN